VINYKATGAKKPKLLRSSRSTGREDAIYSEVTMSLQEQLDALRTQSKTRIPPEAQVVMQRSIDEVRASGILSHVPKVGDLAPDFALPNAMGELIGLKSLRARGPVVVSFYRGRW